MVVYPNPQPRVGENLDMGGGGLRHCNIYGTWDPLAIWDCIRRGLTLIEFDAGGGLQLLFCPLMQTKTAGKTNFEDVIKSAA